jgi:hypothetical protein
MAARPFALAFGIIQTRTLERDNDCPNIMEFANLFSGRQTFTQKRVIIYPSAQQAKNVLVHHHRVLCQIEIHL